MRKLFLDGIADDHWSLLQDTFQNATTAVTCGTTLSETSYIHQGVRQGGTLSTDVCKRYNNPLLDWIQALNVRASIGAMACPSPNRADDVALIVKSREELHCLLDAA